MPAPDLLASFEGQRQRAAVLAGLFGEPEERPVIGRFTLLRKLGAGGMGVVYAAYDPQLDRAVALKLLRGRTAAPADLLREARLLAQLAHPAVVAVFDVGEIDGQVYLAMEHVAGETLRVWSRGGPRPWRAVLAVLLQAGRGLAAAHAAGIVHRDVKPENMIIDADGRVRVLDFGLAAAGPGADALRPAGTPGYIAPEQQGGRCDARSDQYSFCVTMYEALHGVRPDQPGPRRRVPGWLERAVRRGLAVEPAARWPAMEPLLRELEEAPRRRRRAGRLAAVGVLLGLGFAAASALQADAAAACSGSEELAAAMWEEPRAAVEQALRASAAPNAARVFAQVDGRMRARAAAWASTHRAACTAQRRGELPPRIHERVTACLLARRAEARALATALARGGDEALQRAVEGVTRLAPIAGCVGGATAAVFAPASAAAGVEAVREALAAAQVERSLLRLPGARERAQAALAGALRTDAPELVAEAVFQLGAVEHSAGRHDAAVALLSRAYYRALAADSDAVAARSALHLLAVTGYQRRDLEAAAQWEASTQAFVARFADDRDFLADAQHNLGMLRVAQGRFADARVEYDRALAWRELHVEDDPGEVAKLLSLRAHARNVQGEPDGAIADLRRAVQLLTALHGGEHMSMATPLTNLAIMLRERGDLAGARAALERALALRRSGPAVVSMLENLADVYDDLGEHGAALATCGRAIATAEALPGDGYRVARAYGQYGKSLVRAGRLAAAIPALRRALDALRGRFGPHHPEVGAASRSLGEALLRAGELDEAEALLTAAHAVYTATLGPAHPEPYVLKTRFAELALARGDAAGARRILEDALPRIAASPLVDRGVVPRVRATLARARFATAAPGAARDAELRAELTAAAAELAALGPGFAREVAELRAAAHAAPAPRAAPPPP